MGIIFDKPLIGVVMCQITKEGHPTQMVHNKYLDAIAQAGGVPLALPHTLLAAPELLARAISPLDGILLTGSPSNIEPHHYGEVGVEADADRTGCAGVCPDPPCPRKMPSSVCHLSRFTGAGGGHGRHLTPAVAFRSRLSGASRGSLSRPRRAVRASARVYVEQGGLLAELIEGSGSFQVNSLHQQGIRQPGDALRIEARAADGLIEAVSLHDHPFALAVQWHPEWQSETSAVSQQLFAGFIQATQRYQKESRL